MGIDTSQYTSKSWDVFTEPGAPKIDIVITVCDSANERCPVFPGRTTRLHWSFPDPSRAEGSESERLGSFRGQSLSLAASWCSTSPLPA